MNSDPLWLRIATALALVTLPTVLVTLFAISAFAQNEAVVRGTLP